MFGLDCAPVELISQPVIDAGEVGARVVDTIAGAAWDRAAGAPIPVSEGAQRLARRFVQWIKVPENQMPTS